MEKKSIGSFLSALRKTSGLTQKQLAEKLNVSDKAVSRWERDECAPDLSLVPVLAEIYGVTSDEILRGQRIDPERLDHSCEHAKTVKQRNRILKSTITKFTCRSLTTVSVAMIGVFLAYILNTEFAKANAGFLLGCIFFIAAAVSQVLFLLIGFASVSDEDQQDCPLEYCKGFMLMTSECCLSVIGAAFALCIPLVGKSSVAFVDCVFAGVQWVFAVTSIIAVINLVVNLTLKQKCFVNLQLPLNKLRFRSGALLASILVLLLGLQAGMNSFLIGNKHLYGPHDTVDNLSIFGRLIAEPKTEEGFPMYQASSTSEYETWIFYVEDYRDAQYVSEHAYYNKIAYTLKKSDITKKLVPTAPDPPEGKYGYLEEYGYQFTHCNRTISYFEISNTEKIVPIYIFNIEQLAEANRNFVSINLIYLLTYAIAIAVTLLVYNSKSRKI